jgi:hypothetical protein
MLAAIRQCPSIENALCLTQDRRDRSAETPYAATTTLAADKSSGGLGTKITCVIVYPDGHREIEGVTQK